MWSVKYAVEGIPLESQPFKTAEDAELWKREVASTFPDAADLEVVWVSEPEATDGQS